MFTISLHTMEEPAMICIRKQFLLKPTILLSAFLFSLIFAMPAFADEYFMDEVDLDGDGTIETVIGQYNQDSGEFYFSVDDQEYSGWLEPWLMGIEIVDLDKSDDYLEICVSTAGPSDDYEYLYFEFIDREIVEIGHIYGIVESKGEGVILSDQWMGFWTRTKKYELDQRTREIFEVPQQIFALKCYSEEVTIGLECTVTESFDIYLDRSRDDVLESCEPEDEIHILACWDTPPEPDDDYFTESYYTDWYLIYTASGLTGWAQLDDFAWNVDGIMWAD